MEGWDKIKAVTARKRQKKERTGEKRRRMKRKKRERRKRKGIRFSLDMNDWINGENERIESSQIGRDGTGWEEYSYSSSTRGEISRQGRKGRFKTNFIHLRMERETSFIFFLSFLFLLFFPAKLSIKAMEFHDLCLLFYLVSKTFSFNTIYTESPPSCNPLPPQPFAFQEV